MFLEKTIFTVFSSIVLAFLVLITVLIRKNKSEYIRQLFYVILIGIVTIPVYGVFYLSKNLTVAYIFDSIYFICTDWLAFFMLKFVFEYCSREKSGKPYYAVFSTISIIDSISLLLNVFTKHSFMLSLAYTEEGFQYWSFTMTPIHYIHLGFCYVMIIWSFSLLISSAVAAPYFYKVKYIGVFLAYIFVIIANFVCYSLDVPVDVSVFLYGMLASYICYYSIYRVPKYLLSRSLAKLTSSTSDGFLLFDVKGEACYANPKGEEYVLNNPDFPDKRIENYLLNKIIELKKSAREKASWEDSFVVGGKELHFSIDYEPIVHGDLLIGTYMKLADISEEKKQYIRERYRSTHDSLTGIYNRERFFEVCDQLIQKDPFTERYMIVSNIKDFTLVNDVFGFEAGDKILKQIADFLQADSNSNTVYGRIGEDKFALLLPKSRFNSEKVSEIIKTIQPLSKDNAYTVHLQMGICEVRGIYDSAQFLYDKALIAIKENSSNYNTLFSYYDSILMEKILNEKNIVNEFENAILGNQIKFFLQPIFDRERKIVGAEALCRWQNPVRGLMLPSQFIDTLEKTSLVHYLDVFMWEEACKYLKSLKGTPLESMFVSVNISPKDYFYIDVFQVLTNLVELYQVEPSHLKLEFTEVALTIDYKKASKLFEELRNYGFQIAIDDFGQGYSSLNLLKNVKTDFIKIDMDFLTQTEDLDKSRKLLKFMISVANALDMKIVCERMETENHVRHLSEMGAEYFQGLYFGEPVSGEEFRKRYFSHFSNL